MNARGGRVAVGKVGRPHGLGGEVRLDTRGGMPAGLRGYTRFYLGRTPEQARPIRVMSTRVHRQLLLVRFEGVDSAEQAGALTHSELYVERAEMPALAEGEYYHADLLGARVEVEGQDVAGTVVDIFPVGESDVLVIRTDSGERMVPVLERYVPVMDLDHGRIVVRWPDESDD